MDHSGVSRAPRVLHLPDVVGGHATALARGERALGARAETLCYRASPYGYRADRTLRHAQSGMALRWLEKLKVFAEIRSGYDVYHFNFGSTLLHAPGRGFVLPDLPFYDRRATRLMTFQGDDARQIFPALLAVSTEEELRLGRLTREMAAAGYASAADVATRRRVVEKAARYCHHLFALAPEILDHLPPGKSSFLPYAIEPPERPSGMVDVARSPDTPLRLVHLSTSPVIKGTGLIERAVAAAAERCSVTLDVVIRQPRPDALRKLAAADYLIDQMVLGWYGGTAVEAMWLGVPVICRLDEAQLAQVPDLARDVPILNADPDSLTDLIIRLASDRAQRNDLALKGFAYARKWHSPEAVAARTLAAYAAAAGSGTA